MTFVVFSLVVVTLLSGLLASHPAIARTGPQPALLAEPARPAHTPLLATLFDRPAALAPPTGRPLALPAASTDPFSLVTAFAVGSTPGVPAFDTGRGELFVPNWGGDNVSIFSDSTHRVVANVFVGVYPYVAAYDPSKGEVFVTNFGSANVSVISDSTDQVIASIGLPAGAQPAGIAYDSGTHQLFVADYHLQHVSVIADSNNTVVAYIGLAINAGPIGVAYDSGVSQVFVTESNLSHVIIFSDSTYGWIDTPIVGLAPVAAAYDPARSEVFVANGGSNNVTVISDATEATSSITVGSGPEAVAYDPAAHRVFVANYGGDSVSVIADSNNTVMATLGNYVGSGADGMAYDPAKQSVFVADSLIGFVAIYAGGYKVTFTESGLPASTPWGVWMNGTNAFGTLAVEWYGSTATLTVVDPNGTYAFSVVPPPAYAPRPLGGPITIAGASQGRSITFLPGFLVSFDRIGLPAGTTWSVSLNGTTHTSTAGSILFEAINGTYPFSILPVPGYHSAPVSGSIVVSGPTSRTIVFTVVTYSVSFTETGLPSGTTWWATFNGTAQHTSGTSIGFTYPNGSYPYSIASVDGFLATPSAGTLTVDGANVELGVSFVGVTYSVGFTEVGLPGGTTWGVTFDGTMQSSTASTLYFPTPNGTYSFAVGAPGGYQAVPAAGSVTVAGATVAETVDFLAVYAVHVHESGLPLGTNWSVILGGASGSAAGASITFLEPNGTYSYSVLGVPGYVPARSAGAVVVSGGSVVVDVEFSAAEFAVTVSETGLAAGTLWSVTVDSTTLSGWGSSLQFERANGSHAYSTAAVAGYTTLGGSGSVVVAGLPTTVSVAFVPVDYNITLAESGLPAGHLWSATVGGVQASGSGGSLTFHEASGTYSFAIGGVLGYRADPAAGSVTVAGSDVTRTIVFDPVTYSVSFTASGLPAGTAWSVSVSSSVLNASGSTMVAIELANGSYPFTVNGPAGYTVAGGSGTARVQGVAVTEAIDFSSTVSYTVTFVEVGLHAGATWTAFFAGQEKNSTTASMSFTVPAGTYGYQVVPVTGYTVTPASGTATVGGGPYLVSVSFTAESSGGSGSSPAQVTVSGYNTGFEVAIALAAIALGVGAFALLSGRRPRGPA